MLTLLITLVSLVAIGAGFTFTRRFVRNRLRYVDVVQKRRIAIAAGVAAAIVAAPVVAILPSVGVGTALLFGTAVGIGVRKGAADVRGRRGEVMVL